jgi:hypothetical protein
VSRQSRPTYLRQQRGRLLGGEAPDVRRRPFTVAHPLVDVHRRDVERVAGGAQQLGAAR